MDGPLPLRKRGGVPPQPFAEGLAPAGGLRTALPVGHEVRGDEVVHGVQIAPDEEVVEPTPDDVGVFVGRHGVPPAYPASTSGLRSR